MVLTSFSRRIIAFLPAALLLVSSVSAAKHEPKDFFGGSDHEDYLSWFEERGHTYEASVYLPSQADASKGASMHWSLDDTHISIAVAVRATAWFGFGLSENGGMAGADLFLFEASKPNEVRDAYIMDEFLPLDDDCNNWEFVSSVVDTNSDFLIVELRRLLDTGDPQDRALMQDGTVGFPSTFVITAWGDSAPVAYHGINNRAKGAIRFFQANYDDSVDEFYAKMALESDGFIDMPARNYAIQPVDSEYVNVCYSWNQMVAQGVPNSTFSVVGFEPIIDPAGKEYVHHFLVTGDADPRNDESCEDSSTQALIYGWAGGEWAFALPSEVGMHVGSGGSFSSFRIEIHYDNPGLKEGGFDSSGIRLYYTNTIRPVEIGVTPFGDPRMMLEDQPVGTGLTEHKFSCPGSCTSSFIGKDEHVTVLQEYAHMHQRGMGAKNELIRDGEVVHTSQVDFFRFEQQGNHLIRQAPYEVRRGDAFNTSCYFNNDNNGTFGYPSSGEMCIYTLMYYPKKLFLDFVPWYCDTSNRNQIPTCVAEYETHTLDELPRKFNGSTTEECVEPESGTSDASMAVFGFSLTSMLAIVALVSS
jgi:dopamine beta-monooxygenase